jgi:hypothetical protein
MEKITFFEPRVFLAVSSDSSCNCMVDAKKEPSISNFKNKFVTRFKGTYLTS